MSRGHSIDDRLSLPKIGNYDGRSAVTALVRDSNTKEILSVGVDREPKRNSRNLITSGAVFEALYGVTQAERVGSGGGRTGDTINNYSTTVQGASSLDALDDVNLTYPVTDGYLLGYDSSVNKWKAIVETYKSPTELLDALKTVDGTGSGLDADTLDTYEASAFPRLSATNDFTGVNTYVGSGERVVVKGTSAGVNNFAFLSIKDSANVRQGYFGAGSASASDIYVSADVANLVLRAPSGSLVEIIKTTTERNALTAIEGMRHYNSSLKSEELYNGTGWNQLLSTASDTDDLTEGVSNLYFTNARARSAIYTSPQTLTDGATITWDFSLGLNASVVLGGNRTLAITNATAGMFGVIKVGQDATGSRTIALPAGSLVINGGGGSADLTATGSAVDILSVYYDGTNYLWTIGPNYT